MTPRTVTTRPNERPVDRSLAYFVHFSDPRQKRLGGSWLLWTDSREYAESFAGWNFLFGRSCVVGARAEWAVGRGLAFAESAENLTSGSAGTGAGNHPETAPSDAGCWKPAQPDVMSLTDRVIAVVLARLPVAMQRAKQLSERAHDAPIFSADRDTRRSA